MKLRPGVICSVLAIGALIGGCSSGTVKPATAHGSTAAAAYTRALAHADRIPPKTPAESPLPAGALRTPIARYRRYALAQTAILGRDAATLRRALAAGDRAVAERAWRSAFDRYLRLGAVYGAFGALDEEIDGRPGGLPRGVADVRFTGLHRIEYGLWGTGAPTATLVPVADRLAADVTRLHATVPTAALPALDYATRAHEILEDAQRDFLSGTDVPWSGEGVLATAAGVAATDEVLGTLSPVLEPDLQTVIQSQDGVVHTTLADLRRAHGGRLPTLAELTTRERERLDAAVGALLEQLQEIPGALDTAAAKPAPRLSR